MKCQRTALEVEVMKYELGIKLEDGFERFSDVITKGWIVTDSLYQVKRTGGEVVCPYIQTRRGRTFIGQDDYVIIETDGSKHICGADKVFDRYQKIE